jgi:coenzyme F420-reducing hydrogenase beta subunit
MRADEEGFMHPLINLDLCTHCDQCRQTCPVNRSASVANFSGSQHPKAYAAWNRNPGVRLKSSSGGVFTALANATIDRGGVVFGAALDESLVVNHVGVHDTKGICKLRGSKYVQSYISKRIYLQVKDHLTQNRQVLFTGTPCQVAGLHAAVGGGHDKLLTCDLICHGVPSPTLFKKYLAHQSKPTNPIVDVNFREKTFGWTRFSVCLEFSNHKKKVTPLTDDLYMQIYLRDIALRQACYSCPFATLPRRADITLGDFWGVKKRFPALDPDDLGTSLVLVNSEAGEASLLACSTAISLSEVPLDAAIESNSRLVKPAQIREKRKAFYRDLMSMPFDKASKNFGANTIATKLRSNRNRIMNAIRRNLPAAGKADRKTNVKIITFHFATNYGAVLQAYALQRAIEKLGHSVEIIDFVPILYRTKKLASGLARCFSLVKASGVIDEQIKEARIESFRKLNLRLTRRYGTSSELRLHPPAGDVYICGSDQVWNPSMTLRGEGGPTGVYFLDFGSADTARIAYAASFGCDEYPEELIEIVKPMLKRFNAISVRENTGRKIVQLAGRDDVQIMPDPTLLLTRREYDALHDARTTKHITTVSYIIHPKQNHARRILSLLTKEFGHEVVELASSRHSSIGIDGWLSAIANARFVVTNSFHGVVFSLIYRRPFAALPVEGVGASMNDRLLTLLEPMGLSNRILKDGDVGHLRKLINESIDWSSIDQSIEFSRNLAMNYLENSLKYH